MNGFNCINAQGQTAKDFLNIFEFFDVYLGSSQVLDDMKHMPGARCTHISFQWRTWEGVPEYASTTKGNYRTHFILRRWSSTLDLRSAVMTKEGTDYLGMKPGAVDAV